MAREKQVLPQCIRFLGMKLLLLCSYLLLLFLSLRLVDVLSLVGGISQWHGALQPSSLPILALKDILEQRGITYQNAVEKPDLVTLVGESGHVTKNGVAGLLHPPENTEMTQVTTFSRGVQFYEKVMISPEVWLAIIVASDDIQNYDANNNARIPEMSGKSWSEFQHRLSQLSIRIAILDCSKDRKWCKNRKWNTTRFQLFPRYSYNEEPKIRSHASCFSLHNVYRWILKILQSRVTQIFTPTRLESKWLTFQSPFQWPELHVVILTDQGLLPPSILALSAQYEGSARFAWARVAGKKSLLRWTDSVDISADDLSFPVILAATNEGVYVYGQVSEECYTYTCLRTFLHYFKPTQNASWYASFCVAILLGLLELVSNKTRLIQRVLVNTFIHCIVVYTVWVFFATSINRAFRFLAITKLGALIRGDIVFFVQHHVLILPLSLLLAIYDMKRLTPIILGDVNEEEEDDSENSIVYNSNRFNINHHSNRERRTVGEERQHHGNRERRTVGEERLILPNQNTRVREFSQQILIRANRDVLTDRELEPEAEETEQQPNRHRVRLLPFGSISIREPGDFDMRYRLTREADEVLLNFLRARTEPLSTATAPRHVTTDLAVWYFSSETQVPEGFQESRLCVICQEDFCQDDKMTGLPCKHIFHQACLVQWLNAGASHACPLCRN